MTIEAMQRFTAVNSFQPFAMHLADGRSLDVKHPEGVFSKSNQRTITALNDEGMYEVIDLLLVVSLRPLPPGKE